MAKPKEALGRFLQGNRYWHTDSSFKKVGAKASLLRALEVPSTGGDTEWADMRAASDALDVQTQVRLDGLVATHSYVVAGAHRRHGVAQRKRARRAAAGVPSGGEHASGHRAQEPVCGAARFAHRWHGCRRGQGVAAPLDRRRLPAAAPVSPSLASW